VTISLYLGPYNTVMEGHGLHPHLYADNTQIHGYCLSSASQAGTHQPYARAMSRISDTVFQILCTIAKYTFRHVAQTAMRDRLNFYRRDDAMLARVFARATCPSVCL